MREKLPESQDMKYPAHISGSSSFKAHEAISF